jgi:hypothetical protein
VGNPPGSQPCRVRLQPSTPSPVSVVLLPGLPLSFRTSHASRLNRSSRGLRVVVAYPEDAGSQQRSSMQDRLTPGKRGPGISYAACWTRRRVVAWFNKRLSDTRIHPHRLLRMSLPHRSRGGRFTKPSFGRPSIDSPSRLLLHLTGGDKAEYHGPTPVSCSHRGHTTSTCRVAGRPTIGTASVPSF